MLEFIQLQGDEKFEKGNLVLRKMGVAVKLALNKNFYYHL